MQNQIFLHTQAIHYVYEKKMFLCITLRTEAIKDGNCLLLSNVQCLVSTWDVVGVEMFVE